MPFDFPMLLTQIDLELTPRPSGLYSLQMKQSSDEPVVQEGVAEPPLHPGHLCRDKHCSDNTLGVVETGYAPL